MSENVKEIIWQEWETNSHHYRGKLNDFKIEANKTTNQQLSKTTEIRLKHPIIENKSNTKSLVSVDDNSVTVTINSIKVMIENGILMGKTDIEIINELLESFKKDALEIVNSKLDDIAYLGTVLKSLNDEYNFQIDVIKSDMKKLKAIDNKRTNVFNQMVELSKGD